MWASLNMLKWWVVNTVVSLHLKLGTQRACSIKEHFIHPESLSSSLKRSGVQDSGIYCKKWNLIVIMIFLLVYNDMKLRIFVFSLLLNEPHYLQNRKKTKTKQCWLYRDKWCPAGCNMQLHCNQTLLLHWTLNDSQDDYESTGQRDNG